MAVVKLKDYVFSPAVSVGFDAATEEIKATFVGTRTNLYLVPGRREVEEGFWKSVLSNTVTMESITLGDKSIPEVVQSMLLAPDTTLESLDAFFRRLQETWSSTKIVAIQDLKNLNVSAFCGGSMAFRKQGDLVYTPFMLSLGKAYKNDIKNFYAPIAAELKNKR
ncbi:hypothetical protein [Turneriella parva]|uniref:Uncharacterized protein n=1 Tax=Turneriella parva (strain ATCC BAA-1111 / DSM 21527 / NCTC 11395 / H) TaxID=869212 RepID=I4B231_TURPD|nr:hypothetical protein [Turneriella parva]AFM11338.1 hypothetical protein Turpa_0687 [Turneriella parva DSM 21527]